MTDSDLRPQVDAASLERRLAAAYQGELQIRGVLGVGGFAAVFAAHDPVLQRDVAIKVIDISDVPPQSNHDQFLAEARVVATVEHPHIVPLYRAAIRDGLLCLTMRLVPGRSLGERIAQGPLPPAEAARIAVEVAQALAAAHARGVVHRDVKPENILLDANGHAIVTDFGISLVTGRANTRAPGVAIGTPHYLSPEQALGEDVDGRADVYSLGIVLYEMLAGRLPFESRTTTGLLAQQILETPPPLERFRPDLPTALVAATGRALTKAAGSRPSAAEFATELTEARSRQALLPPSVIKRRRRWRRFRWAAGAIIAVMATLAFAGWTAYFGWTTFTGGALPDLSAEGANIPADLIAAVQADASLEPNERPRYAFVPSGSDWREALIVTDRAILRRSPSGARRYLTAGPSVLRINYYRQGSDRGLIVSVGEGSRPDTLYRGLSGAELGALSAALAAATSVPDAPK